VIAFETDVHINRPIQEVFAYVSDPLTFPRWNSAVQAVRRTSAAEPGVRSRYLVERELPTGRAAVCQRRCAERALAHGWAERGIHAHDAGDLRRLRQVRGGSAEPLISRPRALTWMRRTFAAAFAGLGARLAFAER
jgi:Polyketide cyclase / dehydrase and lipid transport